VIVQLKAASKSTKRRVVTKSDEGHTVIQPGHIIAYFSILIIIIITASLPSGLVSVVAPCAG
jgi:hypothetical protein